MTDLEVSEWLKSDKVIFENITDSGIPVLHRIHPYKQEEVKNLILGCSEFAEIAKIIIFGSSITVNCLPWSDLDIAVDWNCEAFTEDGILSAKIFDAMQFIQKNSSYNIDILQLQNRNRFDKALLHNVMKGVVVYENYV